MKVILFGATRTAGQGVLRLPFTPRRAATAAARS